MFMSGQRGFFLTFQSLSYPLTLMTLEDLIKKKKFFPQNFRYLFWSDWGFYPKIEVSDLLGLNRRTVVSDDMLSPRGMAIDYKEDLLYWVDSHKNTIESVQFNGNSRRIIVSHAGAKFFGVAVFEVQLVQTNFKLISCSWDNWNCKRLYNLPGSFVVVCFLVKEDWMVWRPFFDYR